MSSKNGERPKLDPLPERVSHEIQLNGIAKVAGVILDGFHFKKQFRNCLFTDRFLKVVFLALQARDNEIKRLNAYITRKSDECSKEAHERADAYRDKEQLRSAAIERGLDVLELTPVQRDRILLKTID